MTVDRLLSPRRALGALLVVVGLVAFGAELGPGLAVGPGGAPAAAAVVGRQTDPFAPDDGAPVTETSDPAATAPTDASASTTGPATDDGTTGTGATAAEQDAAVDDAQAQADADLRSVWVVVAGLAATAVGLLVLLVLYVWATNPRRAASRRAILLARAEARADRRAGRAPDDRFDDEDDDWAPLAEADDRDRDRDEPADEAVPVAPAARTAAAMASGASAPVARPSPRGPADEPDGDTRPAVPPAAAAAVPAAVLTRDPEPVDGEGIRLIGTAGAAAGPTAVPGVPVRPEAVSPPVTKARSARPARARPDRAGAKAGTAPAKAGPPPGPAEGDETVRIVPPPPADRPPPRSLIDTPPPRRRPRRVDAPAKKLATPDAERVLVRPGQTPVRVPPTSPPDPPPERAAAEPSVDDAGPAGDDG